MSLRDDFEQKRRRDLRVQMTLAVCLVAAGLTLSGFSLVRIAADDTRMAEVSSQAPASGGQTPGTTGQAPGATAPAESKPGGTRPTTPAPEPARPDADAQKAGSPAALPPAPAEKTAPAIPEK